MCALISRLLGRSAAGTAAYYRVRRRMAAEGSFQIFFTSFGFMRLIRHTPSICSQLSEVMVTALASHLLESLSKRTILIVCLLK